MGVFIITKAKGMHVLRVRSFNDRFLLPVADPGISSIQYLYSMCLHIEAKPDSP